MINFKYNGRYSHPEIDNYLLKNGFTCREERSDNRYLKNSSIYNKDEIKIIIQGRFFTVENSINCREKSGIITDLDSFKLDLLHVIKLEHREDDEDE